MKKVTIAIGVFLLAFIASGCSSKESTNQNQLKGQQQPIGEKLRLSGGWVRPGSQASNSAAYLSISNGTATADTLQKVTSQTAGRAEVHESFKGENGISGMRPAPHLIIEPGKDLYLQPGGLHLMLMNLKKDLAVGDSVTINFTFKRSGVKSIRLPVQIQQ